MNNNFKVVQETDDLIILFDNVDETELTFDYKLSFVRGAKVVDDIVLDYIPTHHQVLECTDVLINHFCYRGKASYEDN